MTATSRVHRGIPWENSGIARLLKLLQLLQPCKYDVLTCLFDLTRQEYLVKDRINLPHHRIRGRKEVGRSVVAHLVEVEDEVELAHIVKERVCTDRIPDQLRFGGAA